LGGMANLRKGRLRCIALSRRVQKEGLWWVISPDWGKRAQDNLNYGLKTGKGYEKEALGTNEQVKERGVRWA